MQGLLLEAKGKVGLGSLDSVDSVLILCWLW